MLLWPFNKYPGTDYETFNWEWILKTVKDYTNKVDEFIAYITKTWNAFRADITKTWNTFRAWTTGEIDQMHDDFANYVNVTEGALNTGAIADGAITKPKIDNDFLMEIENYYVTPEMFGAVGDGQTDDTQAIQDAVDSGKPVIFKSSATYYTLGDITIEHSTILLGNGCTIKIKPTDVHITPIFHAKIPCIIKDFKCVSEQLYPLYLNSTTQFPGMYSSNTVAVAIENDGVEIYNIECTNMWGICAFDLSNSHSYSSVYLKNITIENLRGNNLNMALLIRHCKGVIVKNCELEQSATCNSYFHSIYISQYAYNVTLENITIDCEALDCSQVMSIHPATATEIQIENINIKDSVIKCGGTIPKQYSTSAAKQNPLHIAFSKNVIVDNIEIEGNDKSAIISVSASEDVVVKNSIITGSGDDKGAFPYLVEDGVPTSFTIVECIIKYYYTGYAMIRNLSNINLRKCKVTLVPMIGYETVTMRWLEINSANTGIVIEDNTVTARAVEGARNNCQNAVLMIGNTIVNTEAVGYRAIYGTSSDKTYYLNNNFIGYQALEENSGTANINNNYVSTTHL